MHPSDTSYSHQDASNWCNTPNITPLTVFLLIPINLVSGKVPTKSLLTLISSSKILNDSQISFYTKHVSVLVCYYLSLNACKSKNFQLASLIVIQ
jgi:hypothetical protein